MKTPFAPRLRGHGRGFFARLALLCVFGVSLLHPSGAREAAPLYQDEATEKRLSAIAAELRCLVCQNESLAGSNAELAHDLRREIRKMIQAGKSDAEIMDFMTDRYGDFVHYRPPFKGVTLLLWLGPALLLVGGAGGLLFYLRRNTCAAAAPLSETEQREAERLLHSGESKS